MGRVKFASEGEKGENCKSVSEAEPQKLMFQVPEVCDQNHFSCAWCSYIKWCLSRTIIISLLIISCFLTIALESYISPTYSYLFL